MNARMKTENFHPGITFTELFRPILLFAAWSVLSSVTEKLIRCVACTFFQQSLFFSLWKCSDYILANYLSVLRSNVLCVM